jgi:hypothetical protein
MVPFGLLSLTHLSVQFSSQEAYLGICVEDKELNAFEVACKHAIYCVASTTTNSDNLPIAFTVFGVYFSPHMVCMTMIVHTHYTSLIALALHVWCMDKLKEANNSTGSQYLYGCPISMYLLNGGTHYPTIGSASHSEVRTHPAPCLRV